MTTVATVTGSLIELQHPVTGEKLKRIGRERKTDDFGVVECYCGAIYAATWESIMDGSCLCPKCEQQEEMTVHGR